MPRNSSGTYSQPAGTSAVANATIDPTAYNNLIGDIGNEITNSLPVNGVKPMTGALDMGTHKILNLTPGTAATDGANYGQVQALQAYKTGNYTITTTDANALIRCNGTFTITLPASSTLGAGFNFTVRNIGSGTVTITPNGLETINGASSLTIATGMEATLVTNGSVWTSYSMPIYTIVSSGFTIGGGNSNSLIYTTGTFTITLGASATLGAGFSFTVKNIGSGVITFTPNGAETINGQSSYTMYAGMEATFTTNGTVWTSVTKPNGINPIKTISGAYTVSNQDVGSYIKCTGSSSYALTLITVSNFINGSRITIKNSSTATITLTPSGSDLINGSSSFSLTRGVEVSLISTGSTWQAIPTATPPSVGKSWQDVTASRSLSTTYTNTDDSPREVRASISLAPGSNITFTINGVNTSFSANSGSNPGNIYVTVGGIIPMGATYLATPSGGASLYLWAEC